MIFNKKRLFFHFFITFLSHSLLGQSPLWLHNKGAVEATKVVAVDSSVLVAGVFQRALNGRKSLGKSDLFLYQYPVGASFLEPLPLRKAYYLGGEEGEQWAALCANGQGLLYGVGSFEDSLKFGASDTVLYQRHRSIFVGQWAGDLSLNWARQLRHTGLVQVWDAKCDKDGALYLTGSFQDTLFLAAGARLVAPCAKAPFLLKLNAQGQILWGKTVGRCQSAEGKALALDERGRLYWVGEFSGNFALDSLLEQVYPVDRDLFWASLDAKTGRRILQKQFSGVYDNQVVAMEWQDSVLYLAGHFRGLLYFDSLRFVTGFKTFYNAYLVQLDSAGRGLWGSQSTTFSEARCLGLAVQKKRILLCGIYEDSIHWHNTYANGQHKTEAFQITLIAGDTWASIKTGKGRGADFARDVALDTAGNTWLVGSFQDSIDLGNTAGIARGFADAFIWRQLPEPTTVLVSPKGMNPSLKIPKTDLNFGRITVSPNPIRDSAVISISDNIPLLKWELYHRKKGLVRTGDTPLILTKGLRAGRYCLVIRAKGITQQACYLIKR